MKKINNQPKNLSYLLGGLIALIITASSDFPCFWLFGQPKEPEELRD